MSAAARVKKSKASRGGSSTPTGRPSGASRIYQELRAQILALELKPGTDLDETDLVRRFGLSRTPVREALIRLVGDGLASNNRTRGVSVAALDLAAFPRFVEALDLCQRAVTRLAALRRGDTDLDAIDATCREFDRAVSSADALDLTETNRRFHLAVANACHNEFLAEQYERLLSSGMRMLRIPFAYEAQEKDSLTDHIKRIQREHGKMFKAIKLQDADLAEMLAHEHTQTFRDRFDLYMANNQTVGMSIGASFPEHQNQ
jgi:DNA-binding GntR family transcriptional regulator